MNIQAQSIEEYNYELPAHRIARYPLENRDHSKLLVYSQGQIRDSIFHQITDELQSGDILISNNTRVISARLHFKKSTGGIIEIFCLEPVGMSHQEAMTQQHHSTWKCLVGGAKKWKDASPIYCECNIDGEIIRIEATWEERLNDAFIITFTWNDSRITFSELLQSAGELPLPPYFQRSAEASDYDRYQTLFARHEGSVAAPTAGLHFTPQVLNRLKQQGVEQHEITLHVGAGTFKPVTSETMADHTMHSETFCVSIDLIKKMTETKGRIIAVGTTTMRTLESLYWIGVQLLSQRITPSTHYILHQWDAYELPHDYSMTQSFGALLHACQQNRTTSIHASTSILIAPGYPVKVCNGIITNFHLPKSTLLLLIAAMVGDQWKKIYDHALANEYRFLSYGDSSLLWRTNESIKNQIAV